MPVKRYAVPSRYEPSPYGTVCEVIAEQDQPSEFYVQVSKDEQSPLWISRGAFLEMAFESELNSDYFIEELLKKLK